METATQHETHTCSRLRSIPGVGTILALVMLYEMHDIRRFPSGQNFVSYCRLVTWAREATGTRAAAAGTKISTAHRTWAFDRKLDFSPPQASGIHPQR